MPEKPPIERSPRHPGPPKRRPPPPWFRLEHYAEFKDATPARWLQALEERQVLRSALKGDPETACLLFTLVVQRLWRSSPDQQPRESLLDGGMVIPPLREFPAPTWKYVLTAAMRAEPDILDSAEYALELERRLDTLSQQRGCPKEELHTAIAQEAVPHWAEELVSEIGAGDGALRLLLLDLRTADTTLKEQFEQWLTQARASLPLPFSRRGPKGSASTRLTPDKFRRWHDHQILALCDLDVWQALPQECLNLAAADPPSSPHSWKLATPGRVTSEEIASWIYPEKPGKNDEEPNYAQKISVARAVLEEALASIPTLRLECSSTYPYIPEDFDRSDEARDESSPDDASADSEPEE